MRHTSLALLAALALGAAACAGAPGPVSASAAPEPALGERIAQRYCASCHAIGAEGESRHREAAPFRTLSQNYPIESLAEAFAEGILVGHSDMPEFRLEPAQIDALLGYIESVQD